MAHLMESRRPARRAVLTLVGIAAVAVAPVARAVNGVTATAPGFQAESAGHVAAGCGGSGPTAIAVVGGDVLVAAGSYYRVHDGAAESYQGSNVVHPFGLAAVGDRVFATEPECGVARPAGAVGGALCDVVEVGGTGSRRQISTECGYGLAANPANGKLTLATYDGRIVEIPTSGGSSTELASGLGAEPITSLSWSDDGATLFAARAGAHAAFVAIGRSRTFTSPVSAVVSAPSGFGVSGAAIAGGGPSPSALRAVTASGPAIDLAGTDRAVTALTAVRATDTVYIALPDEIWLLRGRYQPPVAAPPPTAPRASPAATPPRPAPPSAAAPHAAVPVQPPPPPPPAPPTPPLASAAQFAAQPTAAANAALVPGQQDPEGAFRLAATGRHHNPAALVWLALAAATVVGGTTIGRSTTRAARSARSFANSEF
jgi:hypothetical protein